MRILNLRMFFSPILRQPPITRSSKYRLPELLHDARHSIKPGFHRVQPGEERLDGGDDAVLFGERGKRYSKT